MSSAMSVAVGGALGALTRYGVGRLVAHLFDPSFPWATWTVNLLGCFLIGVSVPLFGHLGDFDEAHFVLVVGFLGSFTTFSTFSLDTVALWADGRGGLALLNAGGSVLAGLLCVAMGQWVAEQLLC